MPTDVRDSIEQAISLLHEISERYESDLLGWQGEDQAHEDIQRRLGEQIKQDAKTIAELREMLAEHGRSASVSDEAVSKMRVDLGELEERAFRAEEELRDAVSQRATDSMQSRQTATDAQKAFEKARLAEDARDMLADSLAKAISAKETAEETLRNVQEDRDRMLAEHSGSSSVIDGLREDLAAEEEKSSNLIGLLASCERERDVLIKETIPNLREERNRESRRVDGLVEALSFYADPRNGDRLEMDGGRVARAALGIKEGDPVTL